MIALVGMPGSGKSTVGRHLARQIGWRFADSDVEIERELGESIRSYFEKAGEDSFRSLETSVLASLLERPSMVLATGGGAVLREANRKLMTFTQVSRALQQELDAAHAINRRLLEPKGRSGH